MRILSSEIDSILQQEDIEGYIEFGAPSDEYSSEAEFIASALEELESGQFTAENVIAIVSLIWAQSFNLSEADMNLRLPGIQRVAENIAAKS